MKHLIDKIKNIGQLFADLKSGDEIVFVLVLLSKRAESNPATDNVPPMASKSSAVTLK